MLGSRYRNTVSVPFVDRCTGVLASAFKGSTEYWRRSRQAAVSYTMLQPVCLHRWVHGGANNERLPAERILAQIAHGQDIPTIMIAHNTTIVKLLREQRCCLFAAFIHFSATGTRIRGLRWYGG